MDVAVPVEAARRERVARVVFAPVRLGHHARALAGRAVKMGRAGVMTNARRTEIVAPMLATNAASVPEEAAFPIALARTAGTTDAANPAESVIGQKPVWQGRASRREAVFLTAVQRSVGTTGVGEPVAPVLPERYAIPTPVSGRARLPKKGAVRVKRVSPIAETKTVGEMDVEVHAADVCRLRNAQRQGSANSRTARRTKNSRRKTRTCWKWRNPHPAPVNRRPWWSQHQQMGAQQEGTIGSYSYSCSWWVPGAHVNSGGAPFSGGIARCLPGSWPQANTPISALNTRFGRLEGILPGLLSLAGKTPPDGCRPAGMMRPAPPRLTPSPARPAHRILERSPPHLVGSLSGSVHKTKPVETVYNS